ncbi:MAG: response regulator [Alphaproteobacteria bacterium]|nr:response regulator [Alphaproteobacteria bacterium]MCB9931374.1 response regulator [Alphaproteobacteria bacterium]
MTTKVLIAEDEANIAELLRFLLERAGHETRWVADGQAAVTTARSYRPDVLVLDVMLPTLSGYEVLKAVRADPAIAGLPVLMLTAKGQEKDRRLAQELGANAFITKPFSNIDVLSRVAELATGEV